MIRQVADPDIINHFANHPEIRPSLGGEGEMDLSAGVREPNVFLFGEHGGFCFAWSAPETYETHVMLTEAGRGAWGLAGIRAAVQRMAAQGANHLWARVHPDRPEIALYARLAGYREVGTHTLDIGDGPVAWRIFDWRA